MGGCWAGSMKGAGLVLALLLALSVVSSMSLHLDVGRRESERERRQLDTRDEDSEGRRLDRGDREEREHREEERERLERRRDLDLDEDDQEHRHERRERRRDVDEHRRRGDGERERERREREQREREREGRRDLDADEEDRRRRQGEEGERQEKRREREERERGRERHDRRRGERRFEGQRELELEEPREHFESEGGEIRVWDHIRALEDSDVHVQGAQIRLRERALLLPQYSDSASLAYVEEGEGLVGLLSGYSMGETARRVRCGDVIALPRGIAHWWYNSGNQDLRIIALADTSESEDRDQYTPFALIGGRGERGEEGQEGSILHGFRREFLAEAWDAEEREVEELLSSQRGVGIIRVERDIDIERALNIIDDVAHTDEDDKNHGGDRNAHLDGHHLSEFGLNVRDATPDARVEDAGHFTSVNSLKLPILNIVRLGLIHGRLERNAIFAPHWCPNSHRIMHILRGSARLEIVGTGGEQLLSQRVSQGDVFVIPRFHPAGIRADEEGLEWVTFHTTDVPYVEALAGKTSVYNNLPDQVAAAAFNIDEDRVRELKLHRLRDALLLPPGHRRSGHHSRHHSRH